MSETDDDASWGGDWEEEQPSRFSSLFDPSKTFAAASDCIKHDADQHRFDLVQYARLHSLDDFGIIRCINFIRGQIRDSLDPRPVLDNGAEAFQDEKYMRPVIEDDALLCLDLTLITGSVTSHHMAANRIQELEAENEALLAAVDDLRSQALAEELREHGEITGLPATDLQDGTCRATVDQAYFDSYSYMDIHRQMLEDKARTGAYRKAIEKNPQLFSGATVLDVGCGTGILSMFAARAGASQVHAIDAAEKIASCAKEACIRNKLHISVGGPIQVHTGKVEDLVNGGLALSKSADIIVSEWMGYALFFESMLESVLLARDAWLKPGGAILPDKASVHIAAGDLQATTLEFWADVHGFSFTNVMEDLLAKTSEPIVAPVVVESLLSKGTVLREFDLATMNAADANFTASCKLRIASAGTCHCIVLWFDTPFTDRFCVEQPVVLSTSPHSQGTHWVQTIFLLPQPIQVLIEDTLDIRMSFAQGVLHRSLDITLEVKLDNGSNGNVQLVSLYVMRVASDAVGLGPAASHR